MSLSYNVDYQNAFKTTDGSVLNKTPLFTNSFTQTVNGKTSNVKYYSGIDAEIYFEDQYIDEIVQIQFSVQQNVLPITGYNSYVYDDMALGSRLVQGQFAINFTKAEYLIELLNVLSTKTIIKNTQIISADELQYDEKKAQLQQDANLVDTTQDPIQQWRSAPLWKKNFNIVMSYGDYINNPNSGTLLILDGVQITGCSQGVAASGEPVTELYSFIAKDIQFMPQTISSLNPQQAPSTAGTAATNYNMTIAGLHYSEETGYTDLKPGVDESLVAKWMAINPAQANQMYYIQGTTAYLTTTFNFNGNTPKSITANLVIPITNVDSSQLSIPIDVTGLSNSNSTVKTQLSPTATSYIHSYEDSAIQTKTTRPFSVNYTIYFTDKSGNINQTTISGQTTIDNIGS